MKNRLNLIRWWDLPAAVLLMAAMLTAATRLVATRWTAHLAVVQTLVFFGAILGLAIGKSRFVPRLAGFLIIAYGAVAVPWQLGLTVEQELEWPERMTVLLNRLSLIFYQLLHREAVQDSLLFLVLMCILFWLLAASAGYVLVRYGNAWQAILPGGLALFIIHSFDPLITRRAWYLAVYIFFGLVLVARMTYLHQHNRWQESRTTLPPHLGLDFIRTTILITGLVVLFSWTAPALARALPSAQRAWQPVRSAWNETKDRFDHAFASLRTSVVPVGDFFGTSATLGRGSILTDAQIFRVEAPADLPANTRLYWRARTYETYENGQWLSTLHGRYPFDPESDDLPLHSQAGRWLGSFEFTSAINMSTLLTPPQPIWVSRPGQVEYHELPDGTVDVSAFHASPGIERGQTYSAQASLENATIAQLRLAGTEYPDWVVENYLQLPDTITDRTLRLAEQITAGRETPYDKAAAITDYLRRNITYVEVIEENPPGRQDVIDWFLFDLQKGFCNYYSTAEIVMLRSLGIPARWSVGYAQGERLGVTASAEQESASPDQIGYLVRQRDAHAWPEVYFPSIGWVEFEPTAAQPQIARLPGGDESNSDIDSNQSLEEQQRREWEEELAALREERGLSRPGEALPGQKPANMVYWLIPLALGGILLFLAWRVRARINLQAAPLVLEAAFLKAGLRPPRAVQGWARHAGLPPLAKAYVQINYALSRLGRKAAATETPAERAAILGEIVPPTATPAQQLVSEYQIGVFSRQEANLEVAVRAASQIRSLSIKETLRRLLTRLQRPVQKRRPIL